MEEENQLPLLCLICSKKTLNYCSKCLQLTSQERQSLIAVKILQLNQFKSKNFQLEIKVEELVTKTNSYRELIKKKELLSRSIKYTKEKLLKLSTKLEKKKNVISQMKIINFQERERTERASKNILQKRELNNQIRIKESNKFKMDFTSLSERLDYHRRYLVSEFLSFFSLNPIDEQHYAIINITLPNDIERLFIDSFAIEVVATGLGYIVHMLEILCYYFDVWLPFEMKFFGSRSSIWSPSEKIYLLVKTNEEDFRMALEMLKYNVNYFCCSLGLEIGKNESGLLLPNLLTVLRDSHLLERKKANEDRLSKNFKKSSDKITNNSSLEDGFVFINDNSFTIDESHLQ